MTAPLAALALAVAMSLHAAPARADEVAQALREAAREFCSQMLQRVVDSPANVRILSRTDTSVERVLSIRAMGRGVHVRETTRCRRGWLGNSVTITRSWSAPTPESER